MLIYIKRGKKIFTDPNIIVDRSRWLWGYPQRIYTHTKERGMNLRIKNLGLLFEKVLFVFHLEKAFPPEASRKRNLLSAARKSSSNFSRHLRIESNGKYIHMCVVEDEDEIIYVVLWGFAKFVCICRRHMRRKIPGSDVKKLLRFIHWRHWRVRTFGIGGSSTPPRDDVVSHVPNSSSVVRLTHLRPGSQTRTIFLLRQITEFLLGLRSHCRPICCFFFASHSSHWATNLFFFRGTNQTEIVCYKK